MLVAGGRDLSCERGIGVKHTNGFKNGKALDVNPGNNHHIGHDGVWPERGNSGMIVLDDAV